MLIKLIQIIKPAIFVLTLSVISFSAAEGKTNDSEKDGLTQTLESSVRFMPSRSVSAMPGKVEIINASSEYSYDFKIADKLPVELSLGTEYIGIKNTTCVSLPPHLTGLTLGIETTLPFLSFNNTYLRSKISPSFYSQDWNFDSSSFRIPFCSFLIYQPDDKWTYILGVAVYPDFQHEVLPVLGFIYKPNGKLAFNLIPEKPNITYILNDKLDVFSEFDASCNEFEVTRNNSRNVVLAYKENFLGAGLRYKFNKFAQSSISAGKVFGRSLKYGDNEGKVAIKNGLYTEFRVEIRI